MGACAPTGNLVKLLSVTDDLEQLAFNFDYHLETGGSWVY